MGDTKYTLRIPLDTNEIFPSADGMKPLEYKEVHFENSTKCIEFLGISKSTFYNMLSGRLKLSHASKQHLKDIQIIKHEKEKKMTKDVIEKNIKDFRKSLLEKI